jgi:SWI/SNF-related matrix-associated actin-dependent regulator 1 of chromatin subfamily A
MSSKDYIVEVSKKLLSVCDGAREIDHCGFNATDTGYMHWVRDTFFFGNEDRIPAKTLEKMRVILLKYHKQIESFGYDMNKLKTPIAIPEKKKETYSSFGKAFFLSKSKYPESIALDTRYDEKYKNEIKEHRGRWNSEQKVWEIPYRNIDELDFALNIFNKYKITVHPDVKTKLAQLKRKYQNDRTEKEKIINMSSSADAVGCAGIKTPPGITLYPYQQVGVKWIETVENALISDACGLGKTAQALSFCYNKQEFPVLIVVPACVKLNWQREIKTFCNSESVHIISGMKPYKLPKVQFYIINYDILKSWVNDLIKLRYKILIFDEAHKIKSPKALRTKAFMKLAEQKFISNKIALTGTPIMSKPIELLPILRALDIQHYHLTNDYHYKKHFCFAGYNGFGADYSGANNLDELNIMLRETCMIRRLKKDVLPDLPDKIRSIIPISISNRKTYNKAEYNFIEWYREKTGKKLTRYSETLVKIENLKKLAYKGKMKVMLEFISDTLENNDKIVVVANHVALQEAIFNKFKDEVKTVAISGGMNANARKEAEDNFQNGDAQLMVLSLMAGGVGINLQNANTMIICELGWTPSDMTQVEDRIHRIGSKDTCNYYYLIAENTIEDYIINILQNKQKIIDASIDGLDDVGQTNIFEELIDNIIHKT